MPGRSTLELDGEDVGSIVRWIGHDAAIYPGNSGGPLVNLAGEIIGPVWEPLPVWFTSTMLALNITVGGTIVFTLLAVFARERRDALAALQQEQAKAEDLLLNILPRSIADKLKADAQPIADQIGSASILFADVVDFTPWSEQRPPEEVVGYLDRLFSHFDELADRHGLEKIKTIGDCYMVAAGVPTARPDHARALALMALDMLEAMRSAEDVRDLGHELRVGINSGPVVAGVIGRKRFLYDLWGDAVNTASRMESHGTPGRIQITRATYELLAGATPHYLPCLADNGFNPDFDAVTADIWQRTQILFLCSPGNPTGALVPLETLKKLIALADEHDFVIAADECYSELYFDEECPPAGLLTACAELGREDFKRCVVFHSLSKRSNLPGLRSGFVAGDADILKAFLLYRTYHGCAMPVQTQLASIAAWNDEAHVQANRTLYREKFDAVLEILAPVMDVQRPDGGFYLWPQTPIDDTRFTRDLFAGEHVTVVPGSYLSREVEGFNPGAGRVRMALVAPLADCIEAAQRIRHFIAGL